MLHNWRIKLISYEWGSKFKLCWYRKDFVYIYDGANITDNPAQTLTGTVYFEQAYTSSGRDVYIHFTSDSKTSTSLGFKIEYAAGKYITISRNASNF